MRFIVKVLLIILLGLIAYNYFFGDDTERETSSLVVDNAKQLGQSVWEMIKVEKDRFSEGKHQEMMEHVGTTIGFIKENKETLNISDIEMQDLEQQKLELDSLILQTTEKNLDNDSFSDKTKDKLQQLLNQLEKIINKSESSQ